MSELGRQLPALMERAGQPDDKSWVEPGGGLGSYAEGPAKDGPRSVSLGKAA